MTSSGKPRLVFFGNERLATGVSTTAPTLRALINGGYRVTAVVSNFERPKSRSARDLEVAEVAQRHNIPVLLPKKLAEIQDDLKALQAEVGVLVAYGQIVPQSVIDLFPRGIINIHPSLLPLHRGPTPIESVILAGETTTGVSIMQLSAKMDEGPVFAQSEVLLTGDETKQALADQLLTIGGQMIIDLLPSILSGTLAPKPQVGEPTYDQLITKADGQIDWQKPAEQLAREIRAFAGWPRSQTTLVGYSVVITKAHVAPFNHPPATPGSADITAEPGIIIVECGRGSLGIERLIPAGKKEMTAGDFVNGHKQAFAK